MTGPGAAHPDRRQRKSRAALQRALLGLIAEKPYADITIEDITERADVARATFYAHYRDKPTLLHEASRELVEGLAAAAASVAARTALYDGRAVIATFEHAGAHPELYRLVLSGEGGPAIRCELIAVYERTVTSVFTHLTTVSSSEPRVPVGVTITAFVGALTWTIESWLDDPAALGAGQAALRFVQGQVGGLEWCLGFDPGETRFVPADAPAG
jgi:AcrR family transcriptional regulator